MANKKAIRTRIKSVTNTKKITRTMELVATAKSKKAQDRLKASLPYALKLAEIVEGLMASDPASGAAGSHPLFGIEREAPVKRELLYVITANRGLCGGYNGNILREALQFLQAKQGQGIEVELLVQGKKGIVWFNFRKIAIAERFTDIEDKPTFVQAARVGERFIRDYLDGKIDRASVLHQHYMSAGLQKPRVLQVVPVRRAEGGAKRPSSSFIYEPDAKTILGEILPLAVKTAVFNAMLEAATGEQIARRVAMKSATDNAEDMVGQLKKQYNRRRQDEITKQIAEIVGGAAALD